MREHWMFAKRVQCPGCGSPEDRECPHDCDSRAARVAAGMLVGPRNFADRLDELLAYALDVERDNGTAARVSALTEMLPEAVPGDWKYDPHG